jgi:hypothetical protein
MPFVATGTVVKVSVGSPTGNRIAHIIRQGDVLPEGVDDLIIARLVNVGLIEELPSADEVAVLDLLEREEREAAAQAAYDEQVQFAAQALVEASKPEIDAHIREEVAKAKAVLESEYDARVATAAEKLAAEATPAVVEPAAASSSPAAASKTGSKPATK